MSKKKTVILVVYFVAGILFAIAGWQMNIEYYSSLIFATGVAFSLSAVFNIFREYRNTRQENREAYERKMKEQAINIKDERKCFLRYKAAYRTMQLCILVCFFGSGILAWFKADRTLILVLYVMAIAQYLIASVIYKYFCRKM